jgi:hypothetical protein
MKLMIQIGRIITLTSQLVEGVGQNLFHLIGIVLPIILPIR